MDELPFYRMVQAAVYHNFGVIVHKIFLAGVAFCYAAGYYRQRGDEDGASFIAAGAGFGGRSAAIFGHGLSGGLYADQMHQRRGGCVSGGFPAICEEKSGLCQRGTPQGVASEGDHQLLQKIMALGLAA